MLGTEFLLESWGLGIPTIVQQDFILDCPVDPNNQSLLNNLGKFIVLTILYRF